MPRVATPAAIETVPKVRATRTRARPESEPRSPAPAEPRKAPEPQKVRRKRTSTTTPQGLEGEAENSGQSGLTPGGLQSRATVGGHPAFAGLQES